MHARLRIAALTLPAVLALAACGSTTNGKPGGSAPASSAGSTSAGSSSAPPSSAAASTSDNNTPTDAKGLYALMQAGVTSVKTAHVQFIFGSNGQNITAEADEKLENQKVVAIRLSEAIPGSSQVIEIIAVDGKAYAKLPATLNKTGKPYLLLSSSSKDATIRSLATSIQSSLGSASVSTYSIFAQAADSVTLVGKQTINGADTDHYAIVVNPTKLPPDYPQRAALAASGLTAIPVQLYIDSFGRPIRVTEHFTYSGQTVDVNATFSKYNAPVSIVAPPASQVGVS